MRSPNSDRKRLTDADLPRRSVADPLVTVIVRTQGKRPELLAEALLSVAAQSVREFHLLITVHVSDESESKALADVKTLLGSFEGQFLREPEVVRAVGGTRSRPLNVGLKAARGQFVCILDDDDLLLDNHFECLRDAVATNLTCLAFTSFGSRRNVEILSTEPLATFPYSTTGIELAYIRPFSFFRNLAENNTPICNLFVDRRVIQARGLQFDESIDVLEDWDFLLRLSAIIDIGTIDQITTVINVRENRSNTINHPEGLAAWEAMRTRIHTELASRERICSPQEMQELVERSLAYERLLEFRLRNEKAVRVLEPFKPLARRIAAVLPPFIKNRLRRPG